MKVLLVSKFVHHVGGVETYLRWQARCLAENGVEVGVLGMEPPSGKPVMDLSHAKLWLTPSRSYEQGAANRARSAMTSVWSQSAASVMRRALREFTPDVVHFHGTCYQLTPAVVHEVTRAALPAVLTAHEYKLICANQTLFDDARRHICTKCLGVSGPAKMINPMRTGCIKGSRVVSSLGGIEAPIARREWQRADIHVLAPSHFMAAMLVRDGYPEASIEYLDLPWRSASEAVSLDHQERGDSIVYLGRLAPNKGVDVLLRAWDAAADRMPGVSLRIMGEGPERTMLEALVRERTIPRVTFLGYSQRTTIERELRRAIATAHPSQWHENSPFSVRESLMAATPAMVADVGGMPEMVGRDSGWVVPYNDESAWSRAMVEARDAQLAGSRALRAEVERRATTEEAHLTTLLEIYARRLYGRYGARG